MSIRVASHSRLRFGQSLLVDGIEFFDTVDFPAVERQTDDIEYVVSSTDRIDTLAANFYGDPVLWWVIAVANDMEDLPGALNQGDVLRIPAPRYVLQMFFEKAST